MKYLIRLFVPLTILTLAIYFAGCENHNPIASLKQNMSESAPEMIIQTANGPVRVLQVDPAYLASRSPVMNKTIESDTVFYIDEFMEAEHGDKLEIKGDHYGRSKIEIKDHALHTDMTVYMEWPSGNTYEGQIGSLEYGTNVVLSEPAPLELTYKRADLAGVNENNLALFIYNANTNQWENLNADVDQGNKKFKTHITRFGRFGIFAVENGELSDVYVLDPNVFFVKKHIKKEKGGKVEVGDKESGKSKLDFKKHDLPIDATISFEWAPSATLSGMLDNLEFGPHGLQFNNPVKCELSYKMADLTGVDEDSLQIYYYNDVTGIWELIGGTVDTHKRIVTAYLHHFSRYAIGAE